jgi:integrase
VLSAWGSTKLRFITTDRIKEWITDMSEDGLAPATVTKAVQLAFGELHVFHDLRHTHAALLIEQGEHPL